MNWIVCERMRNNIANNDIYNNGYVRLQSDRLNWLLKLSVVNSSATAQNNYDFAIIWIGQKHLMKSKTAIFHIIFIEKLNGE